MSKGTVRRILSDAGYSGKILIKATGEVLQTAKSMARKGVIDVTDLEKALVKGVRNANDATINAAVKITKKILK